MGNAAKYSLVNEGGIFGYGNGSRVLMAAQDGSLILRSSSTGTGIVLLVPFDVSAKNSYEYDRIENET